MIQNEVTKTITARYSCRQFDPRPIPDEMLDTILEAGKYAANGRNAQAWHFTVVRTEAGKKTAVAALGKNPPAGFPSEMKWPHDADFHGAPVLVIISCDPTVPYPHAGSILAAGNMMLTATSLGLATVWSSAFTKDTFRDEASLKVKPELMPENNDVHAAIFIGYPAKDAPARPPRKEGVVSYL